jgi:hypothetical protein
MIAIETRDGASSLGVLWAPWDSNPQPAETFPGTVVGSGMVVGALDPFRDGTRCLAQSAVDSSPDASPAAVS